MTIFINPGSGPVADATRENAIKNMEVFVNDLLALGKKVGPCATKFGSELDEGRLHFDVEIDDDIYEIEMPGLPLSQVRWMEEPGQDIWDFPRLYVDGSSWIWKFALGVCERDEEDEE